ncbi:MAG: hypothetical protein ACPG7W_00105 [Paracoccaceae bacterium]
MITPTPHAMTPQAYSFHAQSGVTILTEAQLLDLIAERRARGTPEDTLHMLAQWHRAALQDRL